MDIGLLRRDPALGHHALDERVVLGEQPELAVADQVGPRVAHVHQSDLVGAGDHGGERGAHAGEVAVARRAIEHHPVRLADLVGQAAPVAGLDDVTKRLERERRGHVAGPVPAHAVGHREHRRLHEVGVLVPLASLADVGGCTDANPHRPPPRMRPMPPIMPSFPRTDRPEPGPAARLAASPA
jgi:hypothetical protein